MNHTKNDEIKLDLILDEIRKIHIKLNEHDKRFDQIDAKFAQIEIRIDKVESIQKIHSSQLNEITTIVTDHNKRFDLLEKHMVRICNNFEKQGRVNDRDTICIDKNDFLLENHTIQINSIKRRLSIIEDRDWKEKMKGLLDNSQDNTKKS